jgi:hypothetical protein
MMTLLLMIDIMEMMIRTSGGGRAHLAAHVREAHHELGAVQLAVMIRVILGKTQLSRLADSLAG